MTNNQACNIPTACGRCSCHGIYYMCRPLGECTCIDLNCFQMFCHKHSIV